MIDVMVSSTIADLEADRDACVKAFGTLGGFFNVIGAKPIINTSSQSPSVTTTNYSMNCSLFILILGGRYGYSVNRNRSATEIEYDAAFQQDPTKIIVFKKNVITVETKQQKFIKKVSDYKRGYWYTEYDHTHDLLEAVKNAGTKWLLERASIGQNISVYENFLRLAIHIKPYPDTQVYYRSTEVDIEIEYHAHGNMYQSHFQKSEISKNFWGCLHNLQTQISSWRK